VRAFSDQKTGVETSGVRANGLSIEGRLLCPASTFSWTRPADAAGRGRPDIAPTWRGDSFRHARVAHAGEENDLPARSRGGIAFPAILPRS
jgi:hypothetical protein